jgi:prefoldin subunit 5
MDVSDGHLHQLVQERDRLKNAIDHLHRSQAELAEAIRCEGDADRTFKSALEENIVVIASYLAKVERLERDIDELRNGIQHLRRAQQVPAARETSSPSVAEGLQPVTGAAHEAMETSLDQDLDRGEIPAAVNEGEAGQDVVMEHAWSAQALTNASENGCNTENSRKGVGGRGTYL